MDEIKLYADTGRVSPYVMSVFVALREKGLPFDIESVDIDSQRNLEPPFRDFSVTARVPVLVHDGLTLSESSAITEYLEDTFAPPRYAAVYPADPKRRAQARQVQAWLRSDLMPIREERPTTVIFVKPSTQPLSATARAAAAKLFRGADQWLRGGTSSLFGDWCLADTDLALMLSRLVKNGDEVPEHLARYARQQWERPSVQEWVEQARLAHS